MYASYQDSSEQPRTIFALTAGEPFRSAQLRGDQRADIAVIGGGFVGLSAALHAAEAGARIIVMEANTIGWGSAGRNAGQVSAHASKLEPWDVLRTYGPERGARLNEAGARAPEFVQALAQKHGIDLGIVHGGIVSAAHTPAAVSKFRRRAEYWQAHGAPVEYLDAAAAASTIGGDYYLGAVLDRRGIAINPLSFVRGLARAASAAGVAIHEHSKVARLERDGGRWRVATAEGSVVADHVLLCTNAYTDDLWPGLRRSIIPVRGYQIWTRPLSGNVAETILPNVSALNDSRRLISGARRYPDNRIHFGGRPGFGPERAPDLLAPLRRIKTLFRQIDKIEVEGWWSGWVTRGISDGWRLHELAPGLLTAIACNGRGVAMGPIMGRELARYAGGTPERDLLVPFSTPTPLRSYGLHQPLGAAMVRYYAWRDQRELKRMPALRATRST
jgi:glycine/D-amino acid oxidase-like deaminating enzyme